MQTRTYFVTKQHEIAKAMVELLTDRLEDTGWELMLRHTCFMYLYSVGKQRHCLSSTLLEQGLCSSSYWTFNDEEVTAQRYLAYETEMSKQGAVLTAVVSVREQKYRLTSSSESITIRSAESGVYLTATGSTMTHDMLSEYYTLATDPTTLYSATDDEGQLWELTELVDEDL
jgi:hypothetical protein